MSKYISKYLKMTDQGTDSVDTLGFQAANQRTDSVDTLTMSTLSVPDPLISKVLNERYPRDLDGWFKLVRSAETKEQVLEILDGFRPLSWSNEERAAMSKEYIGQIDRIAFSMDPLQLGETR